MAHLRSTTLAHLEKIDVDLAGNSPPGLQLLSHSVIATTAGRWLYVMSARREVIDRRSLVVANAGDRFTWHAPAGQTPQVLVLSFDPCALARDLTPFDLRVIRARDEPRLLLRALHAKTDDEFDSLAFTILGQGSSRSLQAPSMSCRIRMERAKRYIERYAFERTCLSDLSRELGLTPFTAIRQFKAVTGRTPHAYLLELRLNAAKELLVGTDAPIETIAALVGFDDLAYFSRFFKMRTGVSPSAFRVA